MRDGEDQSRQPAGKAPKFTPTVRHLLDAPLSARLKDYDRRVVNGRFVGEGRLCFSNISPKRPIDYETVAWFIRRHNPPDMAFYLDTNFLTGEEKPKVLWEALLEKQIVIPPFVWTELQPWLESPFRNRYMRDVLLDARLGRPESIRSEPDADWHPFFRLAHEYYVNLLGMRKRMARILADQFTAEHGAPPSQIELDRLLRQHAADHELRLARKGREDILKPNFLADEELVVYACLEAIINGKETTILTTDHDIQVQFAKLMLLLDHQYQALLFAEKFADNRDSFHSRPLLRTTPELRHYFADDAGLLVEKPCEPGRKFVEWLLPKDFSTNAVYCLLFGGHGEQLGFCPLDYSAERDMVRLLWTKGETGGKNTRRLGDFNCHVTGFPDGIAEPRKWVVIARERYAEADGEMNYSLSDVAHANFERGKPVA